MSKNHTGEYKNTRNTFLRDIHDDPAHKIEVEIGDIKQDKFIPQFKTKHWDNETNFSLRYIDDMSGDVIYTGDKIKYVKKDAEVHFYHKEKTVQRLENKSPIVRNTDSFRYISRQEISNIEAPAGYELFDDGATEFPVIRSYIPPPGFVYFGYRDASNELKSPQKVLDKIIRYKTESSSGCPVILSSKNGAIVIDVLYPFKDEKERQYFMEILRDSILSVIKKYGVNTSKIVGRHSAFIYKDGIRPKQIGRIAYDNRHLIAFLYIDTPDASEIKKWYRLGAKFRDSVVTKLTGIREISGNDIPFSIKDEIVTQFIERTSKNKIDSSWTNEELAEIKKRGDVIVTKNWKLNGGVVENQPHRYEVEVLLKKKPSTNKIHFSVRSKELNFFYQTPLTEDEKREGSSRPENVEGSYAVYHKTKRDTIVGGKAYKTGKVFHIYRPEITDANGVSVWGDIYFNETDETLSIIIPQSFLDTATYPVIVDPTFGYTVVGGSNTYNKYVILGSVFPCPEQGVGQTMHAFNQYSSTSKRSVCCLYLDSNSTIIPNGQTEELSSTPQQVWNVYNFLAPPLLQATVYDVVFWTPDGTDLSYDKGVIGDGVGESFSGQLPLPNPAVFSKNKTAN